MSRKGIADWSRPVSKTLWSPFSNRAISAPEIEIGAHALMYAASGDSGRRQRMGPIHNSIWSKIIETGRSMLLARGEARVPLCRGTASPIAASNPPDKDHLQPQGEHWLFKFYARCREVRRPDLYPDSLSCIAAISALGAWP